MLIVYIWPEKGVFVWIVTGIKLHDKRLSLCAHPSIFYVFFSTGFIYAFRQLPAINADERIAKSSPYLDQFTS